MNYDFLEGKMRDLMLVSGMLPTNPTEYDYVDATFRYITDQMATYDRAVHLWKSYLPSSPLYVKLPDTIDWTNIKEGDLFPKGVPLGTINCIDRFQGMKARLETKWLKDLDFQKDQQQAVISLMRIGRNAFPGLLQRDSEIDLFIRNSLKSAVMETIKSFTKGLGRSPHLDDLFREIKEFVTTRKG